MVYSIVGNFSKTGGSVKLISALLLITSFNSVQATELMDLKSFLKLEMVGAPKLSKENYSLDENQKKKLMDIAPDSEESSFTFYFGRTDKGDFVKACTVVPQKGKEGPISLGACYDNKGLLTSVKILAHQEERGKQIEEDSFLKQFTGKKSTDAYVLGKDVDGITGATRSSKAIAEALRKASFAFSTFVKPKLK